MEDMKTEGSNGHIDNVEDLHPKKTYSVGARISPCEEDKATLRQAQEQVRNVQQQLGAALQMFEVNKSSLFRGMSQAQQSQLTIATAIGSKMGLKVDGDETEQWNYNADEEQFIRVK